MTKDDAESASEGPLEIALVGDLTDHEGELTDRLLSVPPGGTCILYFDSPGGSPYCAVSLMSLMILRDIQATGIVTGECSSAALWPFAACQRRLVTPCSVLLFHPTKWQSEESIALPEAAEWARHFGQLETEMDGVLARLLKMDLAQLKQWMHPGRYVTGPEVAQAGIAELIELQPLGTLLDRPQAQGRKRKRTRAAGSEPSG
jgi:ATP-dependent protease ClpP protease subunit